MHIGALSGWSAVWQSNLGHGRSLSQVEQLHCTDVKDKRLLINNVLCTETSSGSEKKHYPQVAVGCVFLYNHCLSNQLPTPEQQAQHKTAQHSTPYDSGM